jgi:hypothetical protein
MGTYVWILIGVQAITFWQLFRLRRVVKANMEIVRITSMLIELLALQEQLKKVESDLKDVRTVEAEFKRIIGNL